MKSDRVYILHMLDAVRRIVAYTRKGRDEFFSDTKTQDAVVRNLEIIGEAVKRTSESLKSDHENIPWKSMAGMRDKMIHEYFGVDLKLVWDVVEKELPGLERRLGDILKNLQEDT